MLVKSSRVEMQSSQGVTNVFTRLYLTFLIPLFHNERIDVLKKEKEERERAFLNEHLIKCYE